VPLHAVVLSGLSRFVYQPFCRSLYAKKRCLEHDTPRNNLPFSGVQCRIVERTNVRMLRVSEIHLK